MPAGEGELAESWLVRVGDRYGVSPSGLLATAGVAHPGWQRSDSRRKTVLTLLSAAVRADPPTRWSAAEGVIQVWAERSRRRLRRRPGASFCPACLSEPDGVWAQDWTSPLLTACLQHRTPLLTRCPACGQRPFETSSWTARPAPVWVCPSRVNDDARGYRTRRTWCDADLRQATAPTATVAAPEATAQTRLWAALTSAASAPDEPLELPIGWT